MAKWYRCQTLIVCLFLYIGIPTILGQSVLDRYDLEDTYDNSYQLAFNLLEENKPHNLFKRDVSNSTKYESNSTTTSNVPDNETNETNTKKIVTVPIEKTYTNISLLEHPLTRNLGENGTGIRRNITAVTSTPSSNVTIFLKTNNTNTTNVVNKTVNKSTTKTNVIEINDDIYNDFNIPSDLDTEEGSKKFNESLSKHNVTASKTDPNLFYNTSIFDDPNIGRSYWVNMSDIPEVKVNDILSNSHRRAATVKLSFNFPFYGHLIKNVTIATGGFLYTGDYVHTWLAATQYIAPLMANFDTSISNTSFIKYHDNGTAFTVEWEKVVLQDKPEDGEFTFQVTLFDNGDIIFVYKKVPLLVDQIQELHHPVKVGLSDAYIMDQTVFLVRRKTIYEYDRVNFNKTYIKDWTSIVLKALPTCLDAQDCNSCLSRKLNFECFWCSALDKCSQGYDRHRQNWLSHQCDKTAFKSVSLCPNVDNSYIFNHDTQESVKDDPDKMALAGKVVGSGAQNDVGMSGILAILFLIGMVSGLTFWVFYAYRNPHTTSGQILIRYRPSQWGWRRGEARYTAATIHM
ncbi:plexin domain-containing protein 2 [Diorhabda sublineata]|uniref:plexin domain-containing protein 2 n=1 Tax=Diorhabda sublineata TaxID=1163346 RepID=UPI0024E06789|nr:plexin domain-containing protein 2 [Diorhabda sublineata]